MPAGAGSVEGGPARFLLADGHDRVFLAHEINDDGLPNPDSIHPRHPAYIAAQKDDWVVFDTEIIVPYVKKVTQ